MSQSTRGAPAGRPWGTVTALLTACAATLIGVTRGLDPWVILCRATCAACVAGSVVAVASVLLTRFLRMR